MIIIDECHRGSAKEDSAWREILDYFYSATQVGLTATPKETREVSNLSYFGEPSYTYSLKLVAKNPKYAMRITGDNEDGKAELDNFIDPNEPYPVLVTTSKLMTTVVDAKTWLSHRNCKGIWRQTGVYDGD